MSQVAPSVSAERLSTGEPAPSFNVQDIFGRDISLDQYRGKKLMLSFYRYASCPLCNLRIASLIRAFPDYRKRGLRMIAVFQSSKESILQYVGRQGVPFPMVADPARKLYRLYGVESSWAGYARSFIHLSRWHDAVVRHRFMPGKMEGDKALVPADFLIDGGLVIRRAFYGKDIGDHMPLATIEQFLGGAGRPRPRG